MRKQLSGEQTYNKMALPFPHAPFRNGHERNTLWYARPFIVSPFRVPGRNVSENINPRSQSDPVQGEEAAEQRD